jgi:hypothetical protein
MDVMGLSQVEKCGKLEYILTFLATKVNASPPHDLFHVRVKSSPLCKPLMKARRRNNQSIDCASAPEFIGDKVVLS